RLLRLGDRMRVRDAGHETPRTEVGEEPVDDADQGDEDADAGIERGVDRAREDPDQQQEAEKDEPGADAIRPDLLLEAHDRLTATGERSASSSMRKNSRSRKPPMRAMTFVGTLWMREFRRRTVVL